MYFFLAFLNAEPHNMVFLLSFKSHISVKWTIFAVVISSLAQMNKTIITVVGRDTVGIIARVCTYLADNNVNILDISQTIVQEYFNMMMIVDMSHLKKPFEVASQELAEVGRQLGVQVKCQREDIFDKMHRI